MPYNYICNSCYYSGTLISEGYRNQDADFPEVIVLEPRFLTQRILELIKSNTIFKLTTYSEYHVKSTYLQKQRW